MVARRARPRPGGPADFAQLRLGGVCWGVCRRELVIRAKTGPQAIGSASKGRTSVWHGCDPRGRGSQMREMDEGQRRLRFSVLAESRNLRRPSTSRSSTWSVPGSDAVANAAPSLQAAAKSSRTFNDPHVRQSVLWLAEGPTSRPTPSSTRSFAPRPTPPSSARLPARPTVLADVFCAGGRAARLADRASGRPVSRQQCDLRHRGS